MSREVETRVVEMRFENKQFESGIKQTLNTVTRFKEAITRMFSSNKGLDMLGGVAKSSKSDLQQIAESVSALEKRFSFLGETVRNVANGIRDTIVGKIGSAIEYVKNGIVQGGIKRATNIENAHYQLQALLKDEEQVQKVMDNAMESVDGTAYGFDEAAKAAAMFKASGIETGEAMTNALKGIAGTAAMTNAEYERISLIFTSVAGQGKLMGDQLLQLSSLGLNAPASIATFFNETNEGVSKASDGVKKAVKEISGGAKVAEKDIRQMVTDGKISFQIFAEAMYSAFGESAEKANETFTGSLSNMRAALARIGAEFVSPLIAQNSSVILLINKVKDKINDVKKALTFSKEAGNVEAYSKRFTDSILKMADSLGKWVESLDVASGMKVFYNVVDSIINIFKALFSVIKPVGKAFADVFLSFKVDQLISATGALKSFTEGLILSSETSKNLQDAFTGVFSVIKLLVDGFLGLLSAIFQINPPVGLFRDGLIGVVGAIGRGITSFTEMIRESKALGKVFDLLRSGAKLVGDGIRAVVGVIASFIEKGIELRVIEKIVMGVVGAFKMLWEIAAPYVDAAAKKVKEFADLIKEWAPKAAFAAGEKLVTMFQNVREAIGNFELRNVTDAIGGFFKTIRESMNISEGFRKFLDNVVAFGKRVKESLHFDGVIGGLKMLRDALSKFADWFNNTFGKLFSGLSIGGVAAGAGGLGIVYAVIKIAKALEKASTTMSNSLSTLPKMIGSLSEAFKSWGASMKADAVKKNAEAILILAAALAVLSFTDTDKALKASEALSLIAGVLMGGTTLLMKVANVGLGLSERINYFAKGIGQAMNQLGKAVKWTAVGNAFKSFATSIAIIAGSLIALGIMYRKDADALEAAGKMVSVIAVVMVGIGLAMTKIVSSMSGANGFLKTAIAIVSVAGAVGKIVGTLNKLFKMTLPTDWGTKLGILAGCIAGVSVLVLALGEASALAGGQSIKAGPILAAVIALQVTVSALAKLMKIELPNDVGTKVGILTLLFVELGGLIMALGMAAKDAGGAIKAASTLLALAIDIGVIVAALMILSIIPGDKLLKGAIALAAVLTALALDLAAVGKIADPKVAKTVLNMAIMVGAITAALGLLSLVPLEELAVSAAALGVVLLALATNFLAISKITNADIHKSIIAMIGVVASIGISLAVLANQPWEGILAAGVSMSTCLLAFSGAFLIISKSEGMDLAKAGQFLAFSLAAVPIGVALATLSNNPWQGMLAAAAAMSAVLLAFTTAFAIISKSNPNLTAVIGFVAGAVAMIPIAAALQMLAEQNWNSIMPGAVALATVSASLGVAMALMSKTNVTGVIGFVAGAVAMIPIAMVIKTLSGLSWEEVATGLITLAGGLAVIGVAGVAGTAIAPGLLALSAALLVFAAAIAAVGVALPVFVEGVKVVVEAIQGLVNSIGEALPKMVEAGKNLILGLAQGISSGVGAVVDAASNMASNVVDAVKGFLGIHSPSTVFEVLGINVDEGFANGLLGGEGHVSGAVSEVFNGISEKVDVNSLFGKGEEGSSLFGEGLLSGEGGIDSIIGQITDASDTDLSSYFNLGGEGSTNIADGLFGGKGDIQSMLQEITDTTGIDLNQYSNLGQNATNQYGKGLKNGEGNVSNTVKQITDANKTDVSSYTNLGKKAANNFASGVKSGASSVSAGAASSVANSLKKAIESAVKGTSFAASGTEIASAISKGIQSADAKVKSAINNVLKNANSAIKQQNNTFKTSANQNVAAYATAINSKSKDVTSAIKSMVKKVTTELKSSGKDFKEKGSEAVTNYVKGIKAEMDAAVKVATTLSKKVTSELDKKSKDYKAPGEKSAKTYVDAIKKAMDSNFKSLITTMQNHGKRLVDGLAKGIKANISLAKQAASQLAKQVDQQVKKDLDIHSPSKVGHKRGEQFVEGFANGITDATPNAVDATTKLGDGVVEALDKTVSKSAKAGANIVDAIGKSMIEKVDATSYTELINAIEKSMADDKSAKEARLQLEEDYWRRLMITKTAGADGEKYLEMDLMEFRKAILQEHTDIMTEYFNQLEEQRKGVMSEIPLFQEVSKDLMKTRQEVAEENYQSALKDQQAAEARKKAGKEEAETTKITKENVVSIEKIMKGQTNLMDEYFKSMKYLEKRLKGTNIWAEIKNMGMDDFPTIKELVQKSDKELAKLSKSYDKQLAKAGEIAKWRMQDLTETTRKEVDALYEAQSAGNQKIDFALIGRVGIEETYWTKLLAVKQAGAEAEKYQDMTIQQFREDMLTKTQEIMDNYQQQFEQTRDNLVQQMGLFDEVRAKEAITAEQMQKNLDAQVVAYQEYAQIMASLTDRLNGSALLGAIQDMGVGSVDQLRVLNQMTDDQLTQYANTYDQKIAAAGDAANVRLGEVKAETAEQLKELFGAMSEIDLEQFTEAFDGSIESLEAFLAQMEEDVKISQEDLKTSFEELDTQLEQSLDTTITNVGNKTAEVATAITDSLVDGISSAEEPTSEAATGLATAATTAIEGATGDFQNTGAKVGTSYVKGIQSKNPESNNAGSSIANETVKGIDARKQSFTQSGTSSATSYLNGIKGQFANATQTGNALVESVLSGIYSQSYRAAEVGAIMAEDLINALWPAVDQAFEIGQNVGSGFVNGLRSKLGEVQAAAKELADAAKGSTKKALDVKSPSRVFKKIGMFTGEGFINGLLSCVSTVRTASEDLGEAAIDGAQNKIGGLSDIFTDDYFSANPVICPEVDLSNVQQSAQNIAKLFNQAVQLTAANAVDVNVGISKARSAQTESTKQQTKKEEVSGGNTFEFVQNNYSPKALSRSELYRQTRNQFNLFRTAVSNI